jgi:serine/threonine protein phosphatase PrpC
MGTTLTAALLVGDVAHIASVGDTRAYVFSPSRGLRQVTKDHSIVAALVSAQLLPPDALYTHPRRGQIYRCLGRQERCQVDTYQVIVRPEDRLLLCSDGLWGMVRDAQIEGIVRVVADPHLAAERLVTAANRNGGRDNVSVIVARTLGDYDIGGSPSDESGPLRELASDPRGIVSPGRT